MTLEARLATLCQLQEAPYRLTISDHAVTALDAFLADVYGIAEPTKPEAVMRRLELAAANDKDAKRILRAMESRNQAHMLGRDTSAADERVYELMSVMPYAGWIHSLKRTYILDAAAALTALVERLGIRGAALDVGCHVGYHTRWLSAQCGIPVTGIDPAKRSIALAKELGATPPASATFEVSDNRSFKSPDSFELIFSIDGPFWFRRYDPQIAAFFDRQLESGGVFVVVGEGGPSFNSISSVAARYRLRPVLSDVVGGWHGDRFEGEPFLVFLKSDEPIPAPPNFDQFDGAWDPRFIAYANRMNTPQREKTQAFFRSQQQQAPLR